MAHEQLVVRPNVADLQFSLFDRAIHPELFAIQLVREFSRHDFVVKLMLTEAGHALDIRHGNFICTEVLSQQSQMLPETRQIFVHRLAGERTERHQPAPNITYQSCFLLEKQPMEVFLHQQDELCRDGEKTGVFHRLQPPDRLGLSPLTFVDLQARPGSLSIHVYHTFPDEFAIVKTQTLIDFE